MKFSVQSVLYNNVICITLKYFISALVSYFNKIKLLNQYLVLNSITTCISISLENKSEDLNKSTITITHYYLK